MFIVIIMIPITDRYSSESLTRRTSVKMTLVVKRRNIITRQAIWCNPLNLKTEMYLCKNITTHLYFDYTCQLLFTQYAVPHRYQSLLP